MNKTYQSFIPEHPFINVNQNNFENALRDLLDKPNKIKNKGRDAREWVVQNHDIKQVSKKLYSYYKTLGLS
jgi:hypothetical protein